MKYSLKFLSRETDINKVLSRVNEAKSSRTYRNNSANILFVSLWDKWGSALVEKLKDKYVGEEGRRTLYVVNSFDMPHSFMIFRTTTSPTLVKLGDRRVTSIDRLPLIYSELGL